MSTEVYTDGACLGNPGPGGWAWVVPEGRYASGAEPQTTNQRMEITAAFEAVRAIEGPIEIVSDSTYVVNCFRDRWWEGWLARGWRNSKKEPVANRDLWEPFVKLVRERGDVSFRWVKAHAANRWNDVADLLAVEAARTQREASGAAVPDEALARAGTQGAADEPARGARPAAGTSPEAARAPQAAEGQLPEGRRLLVVGHRPPELGGYEENPVAADVRRRLVEVLSAKHELHPDLVVLTGLALGAETLGAEAALEAGVPFVVVLPYPDPDSPWPQASRHRFRELVGKAAGRVLLQRAVPESRQKAGAALRRRDAWLARHADEAMLVWDEQEPSLGKLFRTLEEHLGEDVWVLRPDPGPP